MVRLPVLQVFTPYVGTQKKYHRCGEDYEKRSLHELWRPQSLSEKWESRCKTPRLLYHISLFSMEMKKKDDSSRKTAIHIYTFVRIYLSVYSLHSFFCLSYFTHIKNRNPKNRGYNDLFRKWIQQYKCIVWFKKLWCLWMYRAFSTPLCFVFLRSKII